MVVFSLDKMERFACFDTFNNKNGLVAMSSELSTLFVAIPTRNNEGKARVLVQSYSDKATDGTFRWYF